MVFLYQLFGAKLLSLIVLLLAVTACQPRHSPNSEGKMTFKLPIADGNGVRFDLYTFEWITNIVRLEGPLVHFLLDPALPEDLKITGRSPRLQFIQGTDGVYSATDDLSMQLLTLQRHLESLAKMDKELGSFEMARWPRKVAVNVNYVQNQEQMVNNALYSGALNTMLFVPYNAKALPLMLNGGVIGHEHFHSIFYQQVVIPLGDKFPISTEPTIHDERGLRKTLGLVSSQQMIDSSQSDQTEIQDDTQAYHSVLLRGFNEGFADVWGWVLSGDVDFVRRSLPSERSFRNMDAGIDSLIGVDSLKPFVLSAQADTRNGIAYGIGNQIARSVKRLWDLQDDHTSRLSAAKWVLNSLPKIREKYSIRTQEAGYYVSPSELMASVFESIESPNFDQCQFMQQLIPDSERKSVQVPTACRDQIK